MSGSEHSAGGRRPAGFPTLLQGKVVQRKTDFETTDSRTLCKIMRDKWLASENFDGVRDAERFKDILRSLSA